MRATGKIIATARLAERLTETSADGSRSGPNPPSVGQAHLVSAARIYQVPTRTCPSV
jgi:hypothetical protein